MNKAFTMAEVLVTIGIIGVVAAMTLNSLITTYQKQQTVAQLKKVYTTIEQAIKLSEVDNEAIKFWNFEQSASDFYNQYIFPYMQKVGKLNVRTGERIAYYRPNGLRETGFNPANSSEVQAYSLPDGTTFFVRSLDNVGLTRKLVFIDLNGSRKPNTFGKDVFLYTISKDYGLVPYGYKGTSDVTTYDEFDRNLVINATRYGCKKVPNSDVNGAYCSALIMIDGWKIADDYPW